MRLEVVAEDRQVQVGRGNGQGQGTVPGTGQQGWAPGPCRLRQSPLPQCSAGAPVQAAMKAAGLGQCLPRFWPSPTSTCLLPSVALHRSSAGGQPSITLTPRAPCLAFAYLNVTACSCTLQPAGSESGSEVDLGLDRLYQRLQPSHARSKIPRPLACCLHLMYVHVAIATSS